MGDVAAARILLPGSHWGCPGVVRFTDGRITAVAEQPTEASGTLTPGLIDLHNNGCFGVDFATAEPAEWHTALAGLAAAGVTAVQPTVITAPLPDILGAMGRIEAAAEAEGPAGARIVGAHLEGPFLAEARRGAHRADWLMDPDPAALDTLLRDPATRRILRTVTLAPERAHGLAAVRRLSGAGIAVSLGHSDATTEEARAAADAGATMVTHVFNAMRPFSHRDPGLPGAALTDPRLWCCLIVDGLHVDPVACRLVFAAAGARVVAVSDSILIAGNKSPSPLEGDGRGKGSGAQKITATAQDGPAAGPLHPSPNPSLKGRGIDVLAPQSTASEDERHGSFGGALVSADATGLGRRPDGTIAGAGILLSEGVRRMIAAGIDPAAVLSAASEAPAAALRLSDCGRIAPGCRADLVLWDEAWLPRRVWIGGVEVPVG